MEIQFELNSNHWYVLTYFPEVMNCELVGNTQARLNSHLVSMAKAEVEYVIYLFTSYDI